MDLFGFLSTVNEAFDGQCLSERMATRALAFFLASSAKTAYTKVVYPGAHYPNHLMSVGRS